MKLIKIFTIALLIVISCAFICSNYSFAADLDKTFSDADSFINEGKGKDAFNVANLKPTFSTMYNILYTIGISVIFIFGAILAVKYMIGSVDEKASVKEAVIPFLVGSAVIIGAFQIWKLIMEFFKGSF